MTDILLINPNTTRVDHRPRAEDGQALRPTKGTKLRAVTGAFGPRYIASRAAYAIAGHAALDALANDKGRKDAVVLACFGDPGLAALKEIAPCRWSAWPMRRSCRPAPWATASRS